MACEHQHSNIVLLANTKFKVDGKWNTWIDYPRFHEIVASGRTEFGAEEYLAPTPDWAIYGAAEKGFDPNETRHFHNRTVRRAAEGKLSDAQLRQLPGIHEIA